MTAGEAQRIAVVIPCFRVLNHIDEVLAHLGPEVGSIYVVDDACPERSGAHVEATCADPRVRVLKHEKNLGVGGAVVPVADGGASTLGDVLPSGEAD